MRATAGPVTRRRHKRLLKQNKGFRHGLKSLYKRAFMARMKAQKNAFRDRKKKKRDYRALWIVRINAAIRQLDPNYSYSRFMHGLKAAGVEVDRKMLAEVAYQDMETFAKFLAAAKGASAQAA
jgi:large subunit ribosomal protein L20